MESRINDNDQRLVDEHILAMDDAEMISLAG
jgi:hypothetical protein